MSSLISQDNTWALWTFLVVWASVSIILEQKYKWASKITGAIIALVGAMFFANIGIIPTSSSVYDAVWDYVVPVAIPLLLLKSDMKKIKNESGRMLGAFHIGALATMIGTFLSALIFKGIVPYVAEISGMITGSYIGGGVNFVAMTNAFKTPENITNATIVADNLVMAVYFFISMAMSSMLFFRNKWGMATKDESIENGSSSYWTKKEISLKDIAICLSVAFSVAFASNVLSDVIKSVIPDTHVVLSALRSILGNMYLIMTTLMLIVATVFSKQLESINGAEEIGTFLIFLFFVVLGVPASISEIIKNGMFILLFCISVLLIHLAITLGLGKLFKYKLDELLLASNACIGGPTTAAAMAIAKGWNSLIAPIMIAGVWGYVLGNYAGIVIGNLLKFLI